MLWLETSELLWNRTSGLCGRHNGNPYDDFEDKSGQTSRTLEEFSNAWSQSLEGQCQNRFDGCSSDEDQEAAHAFCNKILEEKALDECRRVVLPIKSLIWL